jgi:methylmalonyl-CoA mutase N-terminal domain/subunit
LRVERNETVIVGVNRFAGGEDPPVIPTPDYSALERGQVARLRAVRAERDQAATTRALDALRRAAGDIGTASDVREMRLMPLVIDAVRARASVGEISDVFSAVWGAYRASR